METQLGIIIWVMAKVFKIKGEIPRILNSKLSETKGDISMVLGEG